MPAEEKAVRTFSSRDERNFCSSILKDSKAGVRNSSLEFVDDLAYDLRYTTGVFR